ncbi:salicylate hydroxylase [Geosmithia morbida]|uniref:Salicylate hydroxylase n=1 Tax=Geosmithia morbida TaxID=1094350 RepID=A0A9P4YS30_9HYPO|nr:salicylate hydroxylase [Geosmithia morbida]KAF4121497.1 salicylate hydroxylase [Geosmithia morbida]
MAVKRPQKISDSPKDLPVAIIGAGMGGLASALTLARKGFKDIQVFETASSLGFVGAGIQMAPNLVRILTRLGCWDEIGAEATDVLETSVREGSSNEELAHVNMPDIRKMYGYPHCTGHRATLAGGLYKACQQEPAITFRFGHSLESVDSFAPQPTLTVKPRDGEAYQVKVGILIGADGVKSVTRTHLLGQAGLEAAVEDTGQAAYRVLLPREAMRSDPEMMALLDSSQVTRWIGEKRHWICYPIASRTIYNMSSIQPDDNFASAPSTTYTTKGSKKAMLDAFSDFCPVVQRMLNLVPDGEVCEWKLRVHKALPTWVHGSATLVGDACHPTLPHLNQGAALAIEDAAVLAEVLSRAPDATPEAVNRSLQVYELLRKERTTTLVDLAALSGRTLHLGAGAAKEERDRQFAEAKANGGGKVPDKWASPEVQRMIYSHDCMDVAAEQFGKLYQSLS